MRARQFFRDPLALQRACYDGHMVRSFVDRVLAHFGLPQAGAYVWKPGEK